MVKALHWKKLAQNYVACNICGNKCIIPAGKIGRCGSRQNIHGEMRLLNYGNYSSIAVDPIEKKPLYHFHPGTKVLSIGGWGCNFKCKHCQNWEISQPKSQTHDEKILSPEEFIQLAKDKKCRGIAWTYNEPTIWYEYTLECAKLAKQNGLYTAYITNGFISVEALEELAPYLDAYRVDLKSFNDEFYKTICGVASSTPVYESTKLAYDLGLHVEAVTNIIPTYNDSDEDLKNIAIWIINNLSKNTPWHVTRFFPCYNLSDLEPTPIETLNRAYKIGKEAGLEFVYKGNTSEPQSTICPSCYKEAIHRDHEVRLHITNKGFCNNCSYNLHIIT